MFGFLRSLFSSKGIPATVEYERKLFDQEAKYALSMEIQESTSFKRYWELQNYVTSPHYATELNRIKALSYNNSHEALAMRRYKELKKSKEVKIYMNSGEGMDTANVHEFLMLQQEVNEPAFIKQVEYLKNRKRHKKSDAFLCYLEYKELEKSESIKQFFKLQKKYSALFAEQERWVSKLYDNFSKEGVDQNRWLLKPFWGEQLLNGNTFSPSEELQLPLEKNVSQYNGTLLIITQAEQAQGLAWEPKLGFIPKVFNYTSGIASTAASFRQLYGRFEAKVRVSKAEGVYHSFWMGTDTKLPHINIFKFEGNELFTSMYVEEGGKEQIFEQRINHSLDNDYYIYSLLWDDQKITWLINGRKVFECPNKINVPMYVAFSSGVREGNTINNQPLGLEVDWVRCFRKNV